MTLEVGDAGGARAAQAAGHVHLRNEQEGAAPDPGQHHCGGRVRQRRALPSGSGPHFRSFPGYLKWRSTRLEFGTLSK
jgi:hypothetical protein